MKVLSLLVCAVVALSSVSANVFTSLKKDFSVMEKKVITVIKKDIAKVETVIKKDIVKVEKAINKAVLPVITPLASALSFINVHQYSLSDALTSLSIDRLAYCPIDKIETFACEDCTGRSLETVELPPSKAATQMVVVSSSTFILVGFRGTIGAIQQWMSDLDALKKSFPCSGCAVHAGFHARFDEIVSEGVTSVQSAMDEQVRPLYITGHSAGGAIASLFAVHLALFEPSLKIEGVYTFGSPRVGNEAFVKKADALLGTKWFRIVNQYDAVQILPPTLMGFRHVGILINCNTGTTICLAGKRNEENPGGIIADAIRIAETTKNSNLCHLTYLGKSIGVGNYKC